MKAELALIMPVYNEEGYIAQVVSCCREVLKGLGISFRIIVLDDGSKDNTAAQLEVFRSDPDIEIIHQENLGHGPTILRGYRRGIELADWVFQCDSDDEISIQYLPLFWQRRDQYDAVFGIRQYERRDFSRRIISQIARTTVSFFFGPGIRDVNVPYRLIRVSALKTLIPQIPPRTFAPNIIISGGFARVKLRILEIPVQYQARKGGSSSIVRFKLWKSAALSFNQAALFRLKSWSSKQ